MGLLETELKEIRQDIKHYRAGRLTVEQVHTLIAMYSQSEKRMRLMLQALGIAAKHGKSQFKKLINANLMGNGTVIDLSPEEIESEQILCEIKGQHITRGECLDFSGVSENYENCKGCDVGHENKKLLISETPLFTA